MKLWHLIFIILFVLTGCNEAGETQESSGLLKTEITEYCDETESGGEEDNALQLDSDSNREESKEIESFTVQPLPQDIIELITNSSWDESSPLALDELCLVTVSYLDFSQEIQTGQLIVHQSLGDEVAEIFEELLQAGFLIDKIQLIEVYDASDLLSMEANNTYAFCTRMIMETAMDSNHSFGMAIDINPVQNPYIIGERVFPEAGAEYLDREVLREGMIVPGNECYSAFVSRGWSWGGHWENPDYQHFEKIAV